MVNKVFIRYSFKMSNRHPIKLMFKVLIVNQFILIVHLNSSIQIHSFKSITPLNTNEHFFQ